MGKALLFFAALAWSALLLIWLGLLLRRLRLPTAVSGCALALAGLLYLPGCAGALLLALEAFEHGGLMLSLVLIAPLTGLPLALCTLHFWRLARGWWRGRRTTGAVPAPGLQPGAGPDSSE